MGIECELDGTRYLINKDCIPQRICQAASISDEIRVLICKRQGQLGVVGCVQSEEPSGYAFFTYARLSLPATEVICPYR